MTSYNTHTPSVFCSLLPWLLNCQYLCWKTDTHRPRTNQNMRSSTYCYHRHCTAYGRTIFTVWILLPGKIPGYSLEKEWLWLRIGVWVSTETVTTVQDLWWKHIIYTHPNTYAKTYIYTLCYIHWILPSISF